MTWSMVWLWSVVVHESSFYSLRVCMFTWHIRMMTGKCVACFRCCSVQYVHPNVQALKDIGSCPWSDVQYQFTTVDLQAVNCMYIYTHKNLGAVQCRSVKTSFSLLQRLQRHLKPTCLCEFGCFSLIHFSLLWVNWVWLSNLGFFSAYNTDETCLLTFVILWAWLVGVWKSAEETCPCFLAHRKCKEEKQCFWTLHLLL